MDKAAPFKNFQLGFAPILLVIILLLGLGAAVFLVQQSQIFKSRAGGGPSGAVTPQTSFILNAPNYPVNKGDSFSVAVYVRSDIDAANLFAAKLNYSQNLEVVSINKTGSFIKTWVEEYWDNDSGTASFVGGVPTPGLKTVVDQLDQKMIEIVFRPKGFGMASISFATDAAIYKDSDNTDILGPRASAGFPIVDYSTTVSPAPTTRPISTITVTPSVSPVKNGDINTDGRVNLIDLSALFSRFNRTNFNGTTDAGKADLNSDGVVNSFDFSLMRNILITNGTIRSR